MNIEVFSLAELVGAAWATHFSWRAPPGLKAVEIVCLPPFVSDREL